MHMHAFVCDFCRARGLIFVHFPFKIGILVCKGCAFYYEIILLLLLPLELRELLKLLELLELLSQL